MNKQTFKPNTTCITTNTKPIVSTKHSRDRFKEGFRLNFNSAVFSNNRDFYILRQKFEKSESIDFKLKMVSSAKNMLATKYRCDVRYSQHSSMIFVYTEEEDHISALTVCKHPFYLLGNQISSDFLLQKHMREQ